MKTEFESQQLNAFVDGELELTRQLEMEARVAQDARLRAEVDALRRLRETVRVHGECHAAPEALRERIQRLAGEGDRRTGPSTGSGLTEGALAGWFAWRPFALSFALVALLAAGLGVALWSTFADERLMQEAVASHVRATLSQRLVDVASSDRHTVKPWLSSRLDFSPPVTEPHMPGAVFVGGRVDYLGGRPVAALVYRQREHVIDLFVWPTTQADQRSRVATLRGFNAVHWSRAGMSHWLVSDLNRDELASFMQALDAAPR